MDKFWSIFSMPLGLLVCFGPAFFGWLLTEYKNTSGNKRDRR